MSTSINLDEMIAAVERAARGHPSSDIRGQTAALYAAAATLRADLERHRSAMQAIARVDDTRLSAALGRPRTP